MKPYGMKRIDKGDTDVEGCIRMGRASAIGNLPVHGEKARAYRSLRGGSNRKARARRRVKRVARRENAAACSEE